MFLAQKYQEVIRLTTVTYPSVTTLSPPAMFWHLSILFETSSLRPGPSATVLDSPFSSSPESVNLPSHTGGPQTTTIPRWWTICSRSRFTHTSIQHLPLVVSLKTFLSAA